MMSLNGRHGQFLLCEVDRVGGGAEDNVKSQVRHLFKLPKAAPVYSGAVKAAQG